MLNKFAWSASRYYLHGAMGQTLRITFNQADHSYQVLNTSPVSKETRELQVLFDGNTYNLVRQGGQWLPDETCDKELLPLLTAIGRALASRYRI